MVNQYLLIGIIVGVFFVGIAGGHMLFTYADVSNIQTMNQFMQNPQQRQQIMSQMMQDPQYRQQMMQQMMQNPPMMQDMMQNNTMMNMMQGQNGMINSLCSKCHR